MTVPMLGGRESESESRDAFTIPLTVRLRVLRFVGLVLVFAIVMVPLVLLFSLNNGITVLSFLSSDLSANEQSQLLDDFNSYTGSVTAAVSQLIDSFVRAAMPVGYLCFASTRVMEVKQTLMMTGIVMGGPMLLKYLLGNGFSAMNVRILANHLQPVVVASDLASGSSVVDVLLASSTNVSNLVPELETGNFVTNTVLRNMLAPIVLGTAPTCASGETSSLFAIGLMQSFGLPGKSWQSYLLPMALENESYKISMESLGEQDLSSAALPMNASRAATVFIHGLHMASFFFRWGDSTNSVFDMRNVIETKFDPDPCTVDCYTYDTHPSHTVVATELLDLLPTTDMSEQKQAEYFLDAASEMFYKSLSGCVNISRDEATMEFSHVDISDTITFDAVTFEVPLRKNFLVRTLSYDSSSYSLVDDADTEALESNVSSADNTTWTNYYHLDTSNDCGTEPGVCALPFMQEYDSNDQKYMPEPQIKGAAVCLNADGTEDFHVLYDYYDTTKENITNIYWLCPKKSTTAIWVVSLSSRIVGDAMYDYASPDVTDDEGIYNRSTIVNPRKVYSLTTGMLEWKTVDIAKYHNADCSSDAGDCKGLDVVLNVPVNGSYAKSNGSEHLIVGEASIPTSDLNVYSYNDTDLIVQGKGTATRWLMLMTLATPAGDDYYSTHGDLLLHYNLKSYEWKHGARKGVNCSVSAEDYLRHVVGNHYFMDNGLQASYTSALTYLLKDGVVKTTTTVGSVTTLAFDGNEQWMDMVVSIPMKSMAITLAGIAVVVIGATVILALTSTGKRAVHGFARPEHMTAEMVAQMMFDGNKYPESVLARRFVGLTSSNSSDPMSNFVIGGIVLYHGESGESYTLPLQDLNATTRIGFNSPTSRNSAQFQHDEAELLRVEMGRQGLRKISSRSLKVL